ncbi:MAG: T9SS type A sorting domain-containing protein [Bacteroidetes bacterium]|nr:T9SS type A sorting domain-containing protein [Bacteroidota bacterium]
MKSFLLALAVIIFQTSSFAQTGWQWAASGKADILYPGSIFSRGVVSDAAGNTYVLGDLRNADVWFGSTRLSASLGHTVVVKYSASGNLLWARQYGSGTTYPSSITISKTGGVYIAGNYTQDILIDTFIVRKSEGSVFIARLDEDGGVVWAKGDVRSNSIYYYATYLATNTQNDVVMATVHRGDATVQSRLLTGNGLLLSAYDQNGSPIGVSGTRTGYFCSIAGIAIDDKGNGYIAGSFSDSLWIGNTVVVNSNTLGYNGYLYSFGSDLSFRRLKQIYGNSSPLTCSALTCDGQGRVIVSGTSSGIADLGDLSATPAADAKLFVACIDSQLHGVWINTISTIDTNATLNAIGAGPDGNISFAGYCNEAIQFGAAPAIPSYNADRIYAAQYSSTGTLNWVQMATGNYAVWVTGVAADAYGVSVAGSFKRSATFNYLDVHDSLTLSSIYVARIGNITGIAKSSTINAHAYPNPFTDKIIVSNIAIGTNVQLLDVYGRILNETITTGTSALLNTATIPSGTYWLRLTDNAKNISTLHMLKQ